MCYDKKEVGNGVVTERQALGSSEEDESRVYDTAANANNMSNDVLQMPQQQPQGPVIRWERFLPLRSLKVLLVENDDSTRQVVSALLRNCSYEVNAVANGLQAWRLLEDVNNRIDLVLTEVVMPVLSGIGLLYKIMNHKTFKNIPVIMMSSHDSMGLVFKCLSKGAVDFLVKPIRKNELKNLWQHVWRRCHSSSGSGSESGTHMKKSVKTESDDRHENNTSSSDEHEYGSNGPSIQDGSDNGSGTQSSWTKKAAEMDSPQPASASYQFADAPDSTCAQVIYTKPETYSNDWIHITEPKDLKEKNEQLDDGAIRKELQTEFCETSKPDTSKRLAKAIEEDGNKLLDGERLENENLTEKSGDQELDLICQNAKSTVLEIESKDDGTTSIPSGNSQAKVKASSSADSEDLPSLELSLTRSRDTGDCRNDDRNVLRHSDLSAFSKYNTASSANKGPSTSRNVGSCSPHDISVTMKTGQQCNFPSHLNQHSNISSCNNHMSSTAKCVNPKLEACNNSASISAFKPFNTSAFQPLQNGHFSSSQPTFPQKMDDLQVDSVQAHVGCSNQLVRFPNDHNFQRNRPQAGQDNRNMLTKDVSQDAPQCGSSNMFEGTAEGIVVSCSITGSASGSNHGSNKGHTGSGTAINAEPTNGESDNAAGGSGNSRVTAVGRRKMRGGGADDDRMAQREAALMKFRQKRKERCFEKKVRYHSRKKLAEERPRVKGQFVRRANSQSVNECLSSGVASEDSSHDSLR